MPRLKSWSKEQAKQIANINKAIAEKVGVALSKTMQGEFQEKAKKIMHDKVVEDVYSYSPVVYKRRGTNGGMADEDNIQVLSNKVTVAPRKSSNRIWAEDAKGTETRVYGKNGYFVKQRGNYINMDYRISDNFSFANITPPNDSVFGTPIDYSSDPTILSAWIDQNAVPDLNDMSRKFNGHPKHFIKDTYDEFYVSGLAKDIIIKGLRKEFK